MTGQRARGAQAGRAGQKKDARPLTERVTDRLGRTYERRRRPLCNTSIDAMITLSDRSCSKRSTRTFLEVDEFHAVLDAAGELDAEARDTKK